MLNNITDIDHLIDVDILKPIYIGNTIPSDLESFDIAFSYDPDNMKRRVVGLVGESAECRFGFVLSSGDEKPTYDKSDVTDSFADVITKTLNYRAGMPKGSRSGIWQDMCSIQRVDSLYQFKPKIPWYLYEVNDNTILYLTPVCFAPDPFDGAGGGMQYCYEPKIITADGALLSSSTSNFGATRTHLISNYDLFGATINIDADRVNQNQGVLHKEVIDFLNYRFMLNSIARK